MIGCNCGWTCQVCSLLVITYILPDSRTCSGLRLNKLRIPLTYG